jgi:hypothetical protein
VLVQLEREAQLRANAVCARYQHRFLVPLRHFEQRAESANAAQHAVAHRLFGKGLDRVDKGVARVDVHAGVAVRQTLGRTG